MPIERTREEEEEAARHTENIFDLLFSRDNDSDDDNGEGDDE